MNPSPLIFIEIHPSLTIHTSTLIPIYISFDFSGRQFTFSSFAFYLCVCLCVRCLPITHRAVVTLCIFCVPKTRLDHQYAVVGKLQTSIQSHVQIFGRKKWAIHLWDVISVKREKMIWLQTTNTSYLPPPPSTIWISFDWKPSTFNTFWISIAKIGNLHICQITEFKSSKARWKAIWLHWAIDFHMMECWQQES